MKTTPSKLTAMALVVFALMALACLTGCGTSNSHATTSLAVADTDNSRVLIYTYPLSDEQSANVVLGQTDFVSERAALTASGMITPGDVAEDNEGNIYVSDYTGNRILQFKPPFTNGMAASLVIGQPDFVTGSNNTSQNGLFAPVGLAFDGSGDLWVADVGNARILQYVPPFATGMNASLVIGQADFTSGAYATTSSGLSAPGYVAFDVGGNLWVTDTSNNRVLEFKSPFADGMTASLVIGQTDFVSSGAAPTTASALDYPLGIAFDRVGDLWIADTADNRLLEFKPGFANGMSASLVLGQPDFVTSTPNTTQSGFNSPSGISFDSKGNLAVADEFNNRTIGFQPPLSNDQGANVVLGQPNFLTNTLATTATGQQDPFSARPLF